MPMPTQPMPMPPMPPQNFQHQTLQNAPQPAAAQVINPSFAAAASLLARETRPVMEKQLADLPINHSYNEVRAQLLNIPELEADYAAIKMMTLMDDEAICEELYNNEDGFTDCPYLLSLLRHMYLEKYEDLVSKYPGLDRAVSLFLMTILRFDANKIASLSARSVVKDMPKVSARVRIGRPVNPTGVVVDIKQTLFHMHDFYKQHRLLFHIGECFQHMVPTEFASLAIELVPGSLNVMTNPKNPEKVDGLRAVFRKSILAPLITFQTNKFTMYTLDGFQDIADILRKMTSCSVDSTGFVLGQKQTMQFLNLNTNVRTKNDPQVGINVCVVNNMQIYNHTTNVLGVRSYAEDILVLDEAMMSPRDEVMVPIQNRIRASLPIKQAEWQDFMEKQKIPEKMKKRNNPFETEDETEPENQMGLKRQRL